MESYLEKPQTIGLLLDNAILSFRMLWSSLLSLTTLYAILLFTPSILLTYTPISLSSWLHEYQFVYLGINTYFTIIIGGAILYRFFSASNQRTLSNGEAFSIALRKSIYSTLAIIGGFGIGFGAYYVTDRFLPQRLMVQIDFPNLGPQAINLFALLVSGLVFSYFIPSFGLVVTKNYGPIKALIVSFQWMWGRLNRSITSLVIAKIIYLAVALSFFILLFAISSIVELKEKLHLYHLILQTGVAAFCIGYIFSVYNLLLIDLEMRYHLKKYRLDS